MFVVRPYGKREGNERYLRHHTFLVTRNITIHMLLAIYDCYTWITRAGVLSLKKMSP